MTKRISSRDRERAQQYIDDRLTDEEARAFEERLASDAELKKAYDELRVLRDLLQRGERLERDPAFWTKVQARLEGQKEGEHNLLPFPQKYLPLAASGFALLVLLSFSYVFDNRLSFFRFWETGTDAVRSAYQSTVDEAAFIPLFSGLDNDKTLQFALYGSLPLDEAGGTMLNVDERSAEGYRIEVHKEQPRKQKKVTVADFVAEVRPTNVQKAVIDSLLTESRRELEGAVLVGQNDAVAINADLSQLNRAMASGIVSVLEPEQRLRLKRLLNETDAAYEYSARTRVSPPSPDGFRTVRVPRPKNTFVVLSPETVALRSLSVDAAQIQREMRESQARFREVQALREKTIQWLVNEPRISSGAVPEGGVAPRVSLRSRKDRLTIHIMADTAKANMYVYETESGGVFVRGGDSIRTFEFRFEAHPSSPGIQAEVRSIEVLAAPRPDTAQPRKPFQLDID